MATNETLASGAGPAPAFGVTMIDGNPATSVRFEKMDREGGPAFNVSFHMDGKQVARLKEIDRDALVDAVGERNAASIDAGISKGSLKGESLRYEYGFTPAEAMRRVTEKEERKAAEADQMLRDSFVENMAASHPAAKQTETEPNSIEHTPERQAEVIDPTEALSTAARLRQRDRETWERDRAGQGIEIDRGRMQDRAEGEQHRVKQLDQEARRLDKSNALDERAGIDGNYDRQVITEAEKNRRIQIMEQVNTQFRNSGPRHYFKDQPGRIAFRDAGTQLKSASNDQRVAKAMAMMADAKGWKTITVSGHPDFQREVWFEASVRGLEVRGYKPNEKDLEQLAAYQERQMQNSVERTPERERSGSARDNGSPEARREPQEATRASSDAAASAKAKAPPTPSLSANEGVVIEHGAAPFNHDPQEKASYFVKLATANGEKTLWGKDLERAMRERGADNGDAVRLEFKGSQPVTVEALKRDDQGKVIGRETIETNRNAWEVHRSDREKVVAAVAAAVVADKVKNPANRETVMKLMNAKIQERAQAGTLPPVMVYDKTAPTRNTDAERTRPVIERNAERTR